MGFFWTLFQVASVPNIQVLLINLVGAFMATKYCNLLHEDARKSLNRIVFMVFMLSLAFACLARTVTFQDTILWWFLPVNIGLTFMIGGVLGWILVKLLKPSPHLEGIVIAMCSAGNLGNLLLIIVVDAGYVLAPWRRAHGVLERAHSYQSQFVTKGVETTDEG